MKRSGALSLIPALVALLCAGGLYAQPGQTLRGRVVDRATGEPISAAILRVTDTEGEITAAQSDAAGLFSVRLPAGGTYTLTAERLGYREFTSAPVDVAPGATIEVQVRMVSASLVLDSVGVRVRQTPPFRDARARSFYDRVDRGRGVFVTPEQIERRRGTRTVDMLRNVRSVSVEGLDEHITMGVAPRVRCVPTFYINGFRRRLRERLNDYVDRNRLWGIEVYTAPEDAPPQFPPDDNPRCGVVVIWTLDA